MQERFGTFQKILFCTMEKVQAEVLESDRVIKATDCVAFGQVTELLASMFSTKKWG